MGAANALKVYATYSHLDDRPLRLLAYMALVARDGDAAPWFGLGQEALAELALGVKPTDATLRAVRRAITVLREAGAICTSKRATYGKRGTTHVHYRLHLDGPCDCTPQDAHRPMDMPVDNAEPPDAHRPMDEISTGRSPSYDPESIGRSVVVHRTLTVRLKEEEEEELQERSSSKANRRNGELWKADPLSGAAPSGEEPNGHKPTTLERQAWRAAARRRIDDAQEAAGG